MSPNAGEGWSCGLSANENSCTHGAQINFGDLTPYLTYDIHQPPTTSEALYTLYFWKADFLKQLKAEKSSFGRKQSFPAVSVLQYLYLPIEEGRAGSKSPH
jgi:hypothetical protein